MLQKKPDFIVYYYYQGLVKADELLADTSKYPYLTDEDISIIQDFKDKGKVDGHGGFFETAGVCILPHCRSLNRVGEAETEKRCSRIARNDVFASRKTMLTLQVK